MKIGHPAFPLLGAVLLTSATLLITLRYRLIESDISDCIGYVQASHQLARGEGLAFVDPHNQVDRRYYTLYAFKVVHPQEPNRYFGFPPGVPLLAAALERLTGDPNVVHVLVPILAALLVAETCLLGALLVNSWAGVWAGLVLLVAPTFLQFSTAFWSEVPSATFLYLGVALCVIALRRTRDDGWALMLAGASGLMIGATFFMRFSNASVLPAVPVLVWCLGGRAAFKQRRVICLLGIVLAALLALLIFNMVYYGGPFITGYSPVHGWYEQPAFSLAYAFGKSFVGGYSLPAIGNTLARDLGWLLLSGVVGLFARPHLVGGWLLALAVMMLTPYAIYAFAASGINARFVIPAWPAICLLIGRGIVTLGERLPSTLIRGVIGCLLALGIVYGLPGTLATLSSRNQAAQATVEQARRLAELTEPNAVVLSYVFNDLIAVYGQRSVLDYRHMPPYNPVSKTYEYSGFEDSLVNQVSWLLDQGTPVYYVLDQNPPLYNSYEVLRRHFELTPVDSDRPIYRVGR